MTTWKVFAWDGRTTLISSYSESDARQQANDFCGDGEIKTFAKVYI